MRWCLLVSVVMLLLTCCMGDDVSGDEKQRAIDAAMEIYATAAASGVDLESGPCIAEELEEVPGWSVDIAHDPRQDIDDEPENQCQAYRDGDTEHFVELEPDGKLIRAK